MSEWKARRFWTDSGVERVESGWGVTLDGKRVMTPGKQSLVLPTRALAEAIAAEWDAQEAEIRPDTMPLTRAANSAIEKVAPQRAAVAEMLAAYGGTDLLCYRAAAPDDLAAQQKTGWDPWLGWAAERFSARLAVTQGVMPVAQDPQALARLKEAVTGLDDFALTALHDLVTLPGSLILGLAVLEGRLGVEAAHALSRIDEEFNFALWGRDAEADAAAAGRLAAMQDAKRLFDLSRHPGPESGGA